MLLKIVWYIKLGTNKVFDIFGDNYEKVKCEIIAIIKFKNIPDNTKKTRILDKIKGSLLVNYNSNIAEKYINCITEFIPKGENNNICYVYKLEDFIFVYPKELDLNELVQVLKYLYKIDIDINKNYNIKIIGKHNFYFDIECVLILDSYNLKENKLPYFVDVFISSSKCQEINKHLKDFEYKKFTNEIEFNIILNKILLDDKKKNRLEYNLNYKLKDVSIINEEKKIIKVIKKKNSVDKTEIKDNDILSITINKLIKNHLSKNKDNALKFTDIYMKIKELSKYELLSMNQQKMLTKSLVLNKLKTYKWFNDNFKDRFGGHRNILLNYKLS